MMPSLDHCVNNSSEMTALTKTLEVFDTYKHREEKDSDEESFHLPLDDDETDLKSQDSGKNGISNETEEEILDKFANSAATPEVIDSQLEDRLLNDDDDEGKKSGESEERKTEENGAGQEFSEVKKDEEGAKETDNEDKETITESKETNNEESITEREEIDNGEEPKVENEIPSIEDKAEESCSDVKKDENSCMDAKNETEKSEEADSSRNTESKDIDTEAVKQEEINETLPPTPQENLTETENKEAIVEKHDTEKNIEVPKLEDSEIEAGIPNSEMEAAITTDDSLIDQPSDSTSVETTKKDAEPEEVHSESVDKETIDKEKLEKENEECADTDVKEEQKMEEDVVAIDEPMKSVDEVKDNKVDKCENSNDSLKQNEDTEDLFDISVIRDAAEDNAESAYNEAHRQENEDYDDRNDDKMEEESTNEKGSNDEEEEEEMEVDKQEDQLKSDDVDIEETNLKLDCDVTKDSVSDSEGDYGNKTDLVKESSEISKSSVSECRLDEVTGNLVSDDVDKTSTKSEASPTKTNLKRTSPDDAEVSAAKKPRTDETVNLTASPEEPSVKKPPLKTLLSLSDFMKTKRKSKRLTMHDLEEFCIQKMCEVIVHKSELGDVHHQLKAQEQLIESMRKEIQQLTKQARDLEIVNKKLINDLKQQTTTQKPLNPLRITRSVGLQVKFTPGYDPNKRKACGTHPVGAQKVHASNSVRGPRAMAVNPSPQNKQISPQKPQPVLPKASTPILSQALQRNATKPPILQRTKSIETKTTSTATTVASASVIDLTDEDDKTNKNKGVTTKLVQSKNIALPLRTTPVRLNTTQGIRLTTPQGKNPLNSVVGSSTPQVMYVVQSSGSNVLTSPLGPKAVVVNFQSANGILTSALNGSAVSVIPAKQTGTIQLKTVSPGKTLQAGKLVKLSSKHPAPLPPPPIVRVSTDKALKPIPPKPHLTIRKTDTGIILQWKMPYELEMYEVIASYQLYAYQETSASPNTDMWRKVGDVKALALPMACTLTQFADKNKYYFAVRPVDIHKRIGMFSDPEEISL